MIMVLARIGLQQRSLATIGLLKAVRLVRFVASETRVAMKSMTLWDTMNQLRVGL